MQPPIKGVEKVVEWFGYWPEFHDCRIEELHLLGSDCVLKIAAFEMTTEVEPDGHYKLTKHCTVSFQFSDVWNVEVNCDGPAAAIILNMAFEQEGDGRIAVQWDTAIGIAGGFTAQTCSVHLELPRAPA